MHFRNMAERVVERCAFWFSDPAERLQFLQRATAPASGIETRSKFGSTVRWALARWDFSRRLLLVVGLIVLGVSVLVGTVVVEASSRRSAAAPSIDAHRPPAVPMVDELADPKPAPVPRIWLVESQPDFDQYSNGLRVENQFATSTAPRKYVAFERGPNGSRSARRRSDPAGIVFHTTESHMAPFEEDQNRTLQRAARGCWNTSRADGPIIS